MELFRLLGIVPGVTAVIGSGGKSTLLRVLSRELPGRVLLCTSTHFLGYPEYPVILNPTEASLRRAFAAHPVVCAARQTENGKLRDCGLPYDLLASLADFVVVEADGSRRLPLKAHAPHEPVIPSPCSKTVCVVGLSGLNQPICRTVHRPERFCSLTGAAAEDAATPELVACALLREALADTFFLNQADNQAALSLARCLSAPLAAHGCRVIAGSLQAGVYTPL